MLLFLIYLYKPLKSSKNKIKNILEHYKIHVDHNPGAHDGDVAPHIHVHELVISLTINC